MPKTILTGLRANSSLHLGNYIGAILPMIKLQKTLETDDNFFMFVPDLHSFTTPIEYTSLYSNALENLKIYIASGIDTHRENTFLYRQSHVPAHSELTWILSCFTYFGEANKMTQFKDKSRNKGESVSVGLFTYPILMAADILLYKAEYIPLGEDQRQHLELARDLAIRVNNKFEQKIFTVPRSWQEQLEFMNLEEGVRIRSLQDPSSKMSKSVEDPKGTISLSDKPKDAAKKVMSAVTDNMAKIAWDWQNQPGITNLLQMLALLSQKTVEETRQNWEGKTAYGDLKKEVAGRVESFLIDFQTKMGQIDDQKLEEILARGEEKAAEVANQTLFAMQKAVGVKK